MNYSAIILAFLFGVLATLGAFLLVRYFKTRMDNLSAQVSELVEQIKELQQDGPQKLPFKSRSEIENGIAALNYLLFNSRLDQDAIENALAHLLKARNPDKEL